MRLAIVAILVVALGLVGFFFVGGASPAIIVAPETVFHWGPLDVTNTMFTSWFIVALLVIVAVVAGRGVSVVPSGFSGAVEAAVVALYDIVVGIAGEKNGRRFFPLIGTIFFFILISNYAGLLPINNVIGRTEPAVGDKQAVLKQVEWPLIGTFAYIPVQARPGRHRQRRRALPDHRWRAPAPRGSWRRGRGGRGRPRLDPG